MNQSGTSVTDGGTAIPQLISKLCNNFARNNNELLLRLFKIAGNFLMSTSSSTLISLDELCVVNQIRKYLSTRSDDAVQQFNLLYTKLEKTRILHNKAAVLSLFLNLSADPGANKELNAFSMLQKLQHMNIPLSDSKSQVTFLPDDGRSGVKKLYAASNESKFQSHSVVPSASHSRENVSSTILSAANSDTNFQVALKDATSYLSSISCLQSVTEAELIQEVIYSLQGIEGRILKKEPGGLGFIVDPKSAKSLGPIQRSLIERLAGVGFLHNQLRQHCDDADRQTGIIAQSLIATYRDELTDYYKDVAMLQAQLQRQNCPEYCGLTLRRMLVIVAKLLQNLQWLAYIAEQCTDKKGGALISAVHGFLQHGSETAQKISANVLLSVSRPLYLMLSKWLLDGDLNDPNSEFFIEARHISSAERLWHDKYYVRQSMVPSFISMDQAIKVLATGKSINFLRQICKDTNQLPGREALQKIFTTTTADSLYAPDKCIDFHTTLDNVYRETSQRVLFMLKDKFKLLDHLQALRRYLLLGQGDFIRHLLELLAPELNKPAQELYGHTLSAILESAIRVTNAQFEDEEILNRLTVGFMQQSHGDIGWDIFALVYIVDGPVGTIFQPAMAEYRCLFGSLWKAKRMEFVLSNMRKQQITSTKLFRNMRELRPILHQIYILSSEMIHFLHQTQYYFLFEVLECSWAEMTKQVNQADTLDDVINAHTTFLNSVQCGVLLDSGTEANQDGFTDMCFKLRVIYNLILHLESLQDSLYKAALDEHTALSRMERRIEKSAKEGRFALTIKEEVETKERIAKFHNFLLTTKHQIKQISSKYKHFVKGYLNLLASSSDMNLQLLSVRLNFNDYYKIM